tara:strand:+ start:586 stop:1125 length:540 start_codon:yes stop_codon:yes gene_type:complete
MATTYKILQVNWVEKWAQVRFSRDGRDDYYTQTAMGDEPFSEVWLHAECIRMATEAQTFWTNQDNAEDVSLVSDSGSVGNITVEDYPEFDILTQTINQVRTTDAEGNIAYTWEILAMPDELIGGSVRMQRDDLLHHTDHHALSDRGLSAEMTAYGQSLRDITEQEGYPTAIVWPVEPID